MQSLMQSGQLLISSLIEHAARAYPNVEVISSLPEGGVLQYTYREAAARARKLANAMQQLGVGQGSCVATLAWNTHRHLEIFYAVPGAGAVMHTVNPRLFDEQLSYIVNNGGAQTLFFDGDFLVTAQRLARECPALRNLVCLQSGLSMELNEGQRLFDYESLLSDQSEEYVWPELDETTASSMCFTSGTTGNPKGVVYSHRSTLLHALVAAHDNAFGITCRDRVMPVAPMFHVNAWALPYICPLTGASMMLPGNRSDAASLCHLINEHDVTFSSAVPTIWKSVLDYLEVRSETVPTLQKAMIGGTAVPRAMLEVLKQQHGVTVVQVWGMTETSPLGVACSATPAVDALPAEEQAAILREKQGRIQYGIDIRIVDDHLRRLPEDGVAFGHLQVKGPWVASAYLGQEAGSALTSDGWFDTGDVASIDAYGFMKITDRAKDVIKSGGEWISSVDLENIAVGHGDVSMAAVIGITHPKWDERPLLLVVAKPGKSLDGGELLAFFEGKVARWWIPDKVLMVDELLYTATGKVDKKRLRELYAGEYGGIG